MCYPGSMSAIELAIEKIKQMDETHARQLLNWLEKQESATPAKREPAGAVAMLGFANQFGAAPRTTAEWMKELRAGECD